VNRVAITGIGIVSCLGRKLEEVRDALRCGRSGVVIDENRVALGFRSPLTGMIRGFDPGEVLPRKQRKSMPEFAIWAYAAATDAVAAAGLQLTDLRNERTGLIFGSDSSCQSSVEQADLLRRHGETKSIGSGLIFRAMNSTVTLNLNVLLGTRGASWTISSACSSGGHAVGQAADLIALGRQDRVICGGAQEISWESMCSFDGLGAFSTRIDIPARASRPFDAGRDGLVPSGGAAALVLEDFALARARGARILGEVLSYAFSSDGGHISVPSGDGLARAMRGALHQGATTPATVDYICAHATSTPAGDAAEAEAIAAVFGAITPPVSSTKGMTGHELWMSGASQVVYSTLMAGGGFIAPNLNFEEPDESSRKISVVTKTLERPLRRVLCNAAGFGGTNSCLLLGFDS